MAKKSAEKRYYTKALRCPDGSRKYIRGKTRAELDRKVREAQAQLGMGVNINDNTTVAEFAQTWVDVYKRPKIKPQSVRVILNDLNNHILPVIGAMRVRDVKPADCARVMAQCSYLAKSSQSLVRSRMRELFESAIENSIIARNPVTQSIKSTGELPEERIPLTTEQMDRLCRACLQHKRIPSLYTFVLLCGYAGLRASEALGLNVRNVDLARGFLYIREQYSRDVKGKCCIAPMLKTDAGRRNIPVPPILLAHLTHLTPATKDGYYFNVYSRALDSNLRSALARMCDVGSDGGPNTLRKKQTGIDFYVHPHLLRHTYATRCFEKDMDIKEVQYLLGHSSPSITMEIYVHYLAEARQEETAKKINQAFAETAIAVIG